MSALASNTTVMVELPEALFGELMGLKSHPSESVAETIQHMLATPKEEIPPEEKPANAVSPPKFHKYTAFVLGERIGANTLPEIAGLVVDIVASIDDGPLHKLSKTFRSHKRGFISSEAGRIHIHRDDLKEVQTASGWWIDGNVGTRETVNFLEALCECTNLRFGEDIQFPH
jgi:hypothetical protein